jgi:hypothetical protein
MAEAGEFRVLHIAMLTHPSTLSSAETVYWRFVGRGVLRAKLLMHCVVAGFGLPQVRLLLGGFPVCVPPFYGTTNNRFYLYVAYPGRRVVSIGFSLDARCSSRACWQT